MEERLLVEFESLCGEIASKLKKVQRIVNASTSYLNYPMHMKASGKRSDANGEVSFTAWKPGESGSFHYAYQRKYGTLKFKIGKDRRVTVTVPRQ